MIKIAVVTGSTRPGRVNEQVARWAFEKAKARPDAGYELVDIADYDLPLFDEPLSPFWNSYAHAHTKRWSEKIASFDGYVFVTPEYNHSTSGALKNALDYLYHEWGNKAAGFVSYGGSANGTRAVEHLRQIMGELSVADVRAQVALSLITDFEGYTLFRPTAEHEKQLHLVLDQVTAWSSALQPLRTAPVNQAV